MSDVLCKYETEAQLQEKVRELALACGWLFYHPWYSKHSPRGFPDCVLVKNERLIFAELKREDGKVAFTQAMWLDILQSTGKCETYVWRPSDWEEIVKVLADGQAVELVRRGMDAC